VGIKRRQPDVAAELVSALNDDAQPTKRQVDRLMRELSKLDRTTTVEELLDMLLDYREILELLRI
jgi:hypothetical protein